VKIKYVNELLNYLKKTQTKTIHHPIKRNSCGNTPGLLLQVSFNLVLGVALNYMQKSQSLSIIVGIF
jgi:hypothetical protein